MPVQGRSSSGLGLAADALSVLELCERVDDVRGNGPDLADTLSSDSGMCHARLDLAPSQCHSCRRLSFTE